MEMYDPCHPGEGIRVWMGKTVTISTLAAHLGMTRANLSMILNGRMGISAMVALKLADAFPKTDARFWMAMQTNYDLARARRKKRKKIAPIAVMASTKKSTTLKKAA